MEQLLAELLAEMKQINARLAGREMERAPVRTASVSLKDARGYLGCSRSKVFELLKQGKLTRGTKIGQDTMVTRDSLECLLRDGAISKPSRSVSRKDPAQQSVDEFAEELDRTLGAKKKKR